MNEKDARNAITEHAKSVGSMLSGSQQSRDEYLKVLRNPDISNLQKATEEKRKQDKQDQLEILMEQNANIQAIISDLLVKYGQAQQEIREKENKNKVLLNVVITIGGAIAGSIITILLERLL